MSRERREQLPPTVFDGLAPVFRGRVNGPRLPGNQAIAAYLAGYLQDDILVKVDRASMATSLEVRAPFLDAELIDFLAGVPLHMKLHGTTGKYLLRRLMRGRLPDAVLDRRKQGFGVPLNTWLRTSLAPLLREYLEPRRLAQAGILDPYAVNRLVTEHISGTRDRGQQLWPLLLLELWRERWLNQPLPAYQAGLVSSNAS
jgi:asparagine synthase (glutamine-hydrolysing)